MKKLLIALAVVASVPAAFALPIGNPADPGLYQRGLFFGDECCDPCSPCCTDWFSFRVGFYGDYVFNRHLERDKITTRDIENAEIYTNAGLFVVNFWDRVDLFTTLGATNCFIDTQSVLGLDRIEVNYRTGFSWSVGARAIVWQCGCTTLGVEGQYFGTNLRLDRFTTGADTSEYPNGPHGKFREGQVGVAVAHRIHNFVPYIGAKWSHIHVDNGFANILGVTFPDWKNKKRWGYAVGVTIVDCDIATVSAEGRFGDEKAVAVNGQVRF